jgi:hypothetical protein
MKLKGLILTVTVVLATNAVLLALVARNRTGEPQATIELTERELRLTPGDTENTGVVLTLAWDSPFGFNVPQGSRYPWFDRAKLESFGFDCRLPLTDLAAERHYQTQSMLFRPGFAVLEYGGEAWQRVLEREIEQAERLRQTPGIQRAETPEALKERTDNAVARRSRLVVVDAGPDASALRRRYPDRTRFLVTQAIVALVYVPRSREPNGEGARLTGMVANILPEVVYVPREVHTPGDILSTKPASDEWPRTLLKHDPRYRVTLAYGKRLEPRVVNVQAGF